MSRVTIGVSLKTYFGHEQARAWFADVAARVASHPAVAGGDVRLFVIPTYLQIPAALAAFSGTPVLVGAQDVSEFAPGAFTGEIAAEELAEIGVAVTEVGHAERRRLFNETDAVTAVKAACVLRHGITPVLCIGEEEHLSGGAAARANVEQLAANLHDVPAGAVIVAYEPVWAIGAAEPASDGHIATVVCALRAVIDADPDRSGSVVIYGGSAGPGQLTRLGPHIDGLFLGRFAHEPDALVAVLDEAHGLNGSGPGHLPGATRLTAGKRMNDLPHRDDGDQGGGEPARHLPDPSPCHPPTFARRRLGVAEVTPRRMP